MVIMFINRSGAMVLAFISLYLTTTLDFSLSQAGWVMGAYGVGSIIGSFLGGQWTDRYGYYHIQFFSLIVSGILLVILIFFTQFIPILITIFLIALTGDTLRPANSVAIAHFSKEETRTRSYSLMRFAINLGFSIGPALGGLIASIFGYKWIFLIDAATCFAAALLLYRYLPYQKPSMKPDLTIETIRSQSAYKDYYYLFFIALVTMYGILFFQLLSSVPLFWEREWKYSERTIGFLLGLNGLIIVLVEMPIVKSLEGKVRPLVMIALGTFCLALGFLLLNLGWISLWAAILFIFFFSISEIFAMPYMLNYAIAKPEVDRRGQYMALYAMAYGIAHVMAPVFSLNIADRYSFSVLYWILMMTSIGLTVVYIWFGKKMV
jgi:predicted MFS family arabinose efflux permease